MRGIFPIWKIDSRELIREFFALGFGTVICCVNDAYLDETAVGRNIDEDFIARCRRTWIPCGENGEFHSFAFAGPVFKQPVKFKVGEKVYRPVEVDASNRFQFELMFARPPARGRRRAFGFATCYPHKINEL